MVDKKECIQIEIATSYQGLQLRIGDVAGSISFHNLDKDHILELIGEEINKHWKKVELKV